MTARLKLFLSGLFISLSIVTLGMLNFGGFVLIKQQFASTREKHDVYHHVIEVALNLQIDFKVQVQEWKNVLLRGHEPKDFEKYYAQFEEREEAVRRGLDELIANKELGPAILERAKEFRIIHQKLGASYRKALDREKLGTGEGIFSIDRQVRGIDRPPMLALDQLVEVISTSSLHDSEASSVKMSKLVTVLITLSAVSLAAAIGLVVYYMLDRRKYERRLSSVIKRADQANKAKSRFLAHMSHEIRTPMNGIVAAVDMLKEEYDFPPEGREAIEVIQNSSESLIVIVNDILDLSRIEAGKMILKKEPLEMNGFLRILQKTMQPLADNKNLQMKFTWPAEGKLIVETDPVRLRQVLMNLLSNAIKFTDEGSVTLDAEFVDTDAGFADIILRVSDTGIGIPEEKQNLLFNAFTQMDNSLSRSHQGSGLGLAICKAIVDAMGGTISVKSAEATGSTFTVKVRLSKPQSVLNVDVQNDNVHFASDKPLLDSVLIVDDVKTNLMVAKGLLRQLNISSDVAESGFEAIEKAIAKRYDLILMDCQMPEMDGYEAARIIRETVHHPGRRSIIIALTAHAMEDHHQESIEQGMDEHLNKPVRQKDLRDCLQQFFRLPEAISPRTPVPFFDTGGALVVQASRMN